MRRVLLGFEDTRIRTPQRSVLSPEVMRWVLGCWRKCWSSNCQRRIVMMLVIGIDEKKVYSQKALKKQSRAE